MTFTLSIRNTPDSFTWEPTPADRTRTVMSHRKPLEALNEDGGPTWAELATILLDIPGDRAGDYAPEPRAKRYCELHLVRRDHKPGNCPKCGGGKVLLDVTEGEVPGWRFSCRSCKHRVEALEPDEAIAAWARTEIA